MGNKIIKSRYSKDLRVRKKINQFGIQHGDARALSKKLLANSVDVTITSPPYFDLKDYGVKEQIGFGQEYPIYLDDLQNVFSEIYRATKSTGSLWIVIDTFRSNQEVLPLPFDLAAKLKVVGWKLRDVIIWKKERTLPWTHKGTTRKIFEYILVFAKDNKRIRYFPDKHRETVDLKKWWVRYPERYSPKGKALEEIWSYDIPTQGSWGKNYIRHFCPLPAGLVSRIINLTTNVGDVVLDPFSGTGTVPAQASFLGRKYIGFELNKKYIRMFQGYISKNRRAKLAEVDADQSHVDAKNFEKQIIDLRVLKYARLLYRAAVKKVGMANVRFVFARHLSGVSYVSHKRCAAEFRILVSEKSVKSIQEHLSKICLIPPLSKFGIGEMVLVTSKLSGITSAYKNKKIYTYTATNSHKFLACVDLGAALEGKTPVLSTIRAQVEVPDD
jgi:DNA modification methylase